MNVVIYIFLLHSNGRIHCYIELNSKGMPIKLFLKRNAEFIQLANLIKVKSNRGFAGIRSAWCATKGCGLYVKYNSLIRVEFNSKYYCFGGLYNPLPNSLKGKTTYTTIDGDKQFPPHGTMKLSCQQFCKKCTFLLIQFIYGRYCIDFKEYKSKHENNWDYGSVPILHIAEKEKENESSADSKSNSDTDE